MKQLLPACATNFSASSKELYTRWSHFSFIKLLTNSPLGLDWWCILHYDVSSFGTAPNRENIPCNGVVLCWRTQCSCRFFSNSLSKKSLADSAVGRLCEWRSFL